MSPWRLPTRGVRQRSGVAHLMLRPHAFLCLFLGALEETVYGQGSHREKKTGGGLPGDWIGAVFLV